MELRSTVLPDKYSEILLDIFGCIHVRNNANYIKVEDCKLATLLKTLTAEICEAGSKRFVYVP